LPKISSGGRNQGGIRAFGRVPSFGPGAAILRIPDFRRVFDTLPSPYMVLDRALNFVCVNEAYERVTMRQAEVLAGRYVFDMFPNEGESGRRLKASFERVLEVGEVDTLAYLHYDIPVPAERGGGFERRYWTCTHTPLFDGEGRVEFIVQNTVDVTELAQLMEATSLPFRLRPGEAQLLEKAQHADRLREVVLAESNEFRRLFQQAPGFIAILTGPDHVFTFANDAYLRLVGGRSVIGKAVGEALPEVVDQGFVGMLDGVFKTGRPHSAEAALVRLQRAAGGEVEDCYLDFAYDAIRDGDDRITGVFVQGMDRTEAVRTQQRQKLLLDELNHRVKNTLATVQSIASQTLRSASDLETARNDVEARIVALSKAHNLLSAQEWASAELAEIVRQEMSAFDAARRRAGAGCDPDAAGVDLVRTAAARIVDQRRQVRLVLGAGRQDIDPLAARAARRPLARMARTGRAAGRGSGPARLRLPDDPHDRQR